ncbi:carbamate kinase [Escherichia coli]|nr:carbamate kinase [Escherichia coli]
MKTLVVALGGNALLQRGEALTAENQYRNIASAVPALARLARSYRLAIVHGNGPQVGLLALQNLAWKEVEPYPLDVLVAESQGDDWLYAGAEFERTAADAARDDGADAH